jgi:carboxylesterase
MIKQKNIVDRALEPIDRALGAWIGLLDMIGLKKPVGSLAYLGMKKVFYSQYKWLNDLKIIGADNVPEEGGVVLAVNHQSWLDVSVVAAACPRRVYFIAKTEFRDWPILGHMVRWSESTFIDRSGDEDTLKDIVETLQAGKPVVIFPEGTIPGEEDFSRTDVESDTGLLHGYTGAVRLALRAQVPLVPLGLSGTGRAMPPEIYPRLEQTSMPSSTAITARFGEPITYESYAGRDVGRAALRHMTDVMMSNISELVDHRANLVPQEVPVPKPHTPDKLGVLLLHGFTSHTDAVSGLIPRLNEAGIPYQMPVLRGHGTRYQDLVNVKAHDWFVDAERALIDLWNEVDQVLIVGFSMGGLVALELAMRHPGKCAGVVSIGACLKFRDPLARFSRNLAKVVKYWQSPSPFNDKELAKKSKNYEKFPVETFASLYDYTREVAQKLGDVHVPLLILQSKEDQIVAPVSAMLIHRQVSSPRREIIWYEDSGHEMLQDLEAEKVKDDVMDFVRLFVKVS